MFDQLQELLGPVGYVLGLMLGGLVWAYRSERTERMDAQKTIGDLQEKRVTESRDTTKELFAATQTLEKAIAIIRVQP